MGLRTPTRHQPAGPYGRVSRKNRFPTGGETVAFMVALLLLTVPPNRIQLVVLKSPFCCNIQPAEVDVHDTNTAVPAPVIVSVGAPAV